MKHETPSAPISLGPQASQNVEWSLNVHWLPISHGFFTQSSTVVATSHTALDKSSLGSSMVVLVIWIVAAAVIDRDAPCTVRC